MLVTENVKSNYAEPYIILKGFSLNAFSNASKTLFTIGTKSLVNSHILYLFYSPSVMSKMLTETVSRKLTRVNQPENILFRKLRLDLGLQFSVLGKHENTELSEDRKETKPKTD